jgi:hypothetical protein
MSEVFPEAEVGAANLLQNRAQLAERLEVPEVHHTPPADHYPHIYLWDSCFSAIISARAGGKWAIAAEKELLATVVDQAENGFIPNMQFAQKGRSLDPERLLAFRREATGSNYTQPPVLAAAAAETHESLLAYNPVYAHEFLTVMYPSLKKFYQYFDTSRSNGTDDKLIGVIHPHETGRDSDPTFDFIKPWRFPRKGIETSHFIDKANTVIDYAHIIMHGIRLRSANGHLEEARKIFWVNDVMMNCIYADNLYEMAKLAHLADKPDDADYFANLAETVEERITTDMWQNANKEASSGFYALDATKQPIYEQSISNLFPLVLPNLSPSQLEATLHLMDKSFNTPFPLPSVATTSPNYDPHNREIDRLWRGPTWINTNWYLVDRGLRMQARRPEIANNPQLLMRCTGWANRIAHSSRQLVDQGLYEHYDPHTGKGQRPRVKNFGWSNLAYVM